MFQRTPNFSVPAGNRPLDPAEVADRKANYREFRQSQRTSGYGVPAEPPTELALSVTPDERAVAYEAGWARGEIVGLLSCYADTLIDPAANETAAEFARAKIRANGPRPADRRVAVAADVPHRNEAHLPRHRLLRDVQPAQRAPGRPARDAADRVHRVRAADVGRGVRVRCHRVRDRVRRDDRRAVRRRHPRPRRNPARGRVADRAAHLPGHLSRRVPEPVHDHRAAAAHQC